MYFSNLLPYTLSRRVSLSFVAEVIAKRGEFPWCGTTAREKHLSQLVSLNSHRFAAVSAIA